MESDTSARGLALRASLFLLLVVLVLVAAKAQDTLRDIPALGYKLQDIQRLQPETVFIGTSHTYRHVNVARFDSLQGNGMSYNLGLQGAAALEIHYLAERMLGLPYVKRLVLELRTVLPRVSELNENLRTRRTYYFHDLRRVRLASRATLAFDLPLNERLEIVRRRYELALYHYLLPGQGIALVSGKVYEPEPFSRLERRGFAALDDLPGARGRAEAFQKPEAQAEFVRKVAFIRQREDTPVRADSVVAAMWTDLYRRAEAQGVEVYFVEQVGERDVYGVTRILGDALPPGHVLLLNDPRRYPDLFDPERWFDFAHLDKQGARRVTDLLAAFLP